jgi:beta-glucanase (GH16 family)
MEAHRNWRIGDRLIDGAIVLLSLLLAAWIAVIVAASGSREGRSDARVAGQAPFRAGLVQPIGRNQASWKLVWHDEFNEATCPSSAKWNFEHGFVRNGELQWYLPDNAYCHRGALVLEARREQRPNPSYRPGSTNWRTSRRVASYTSASISSKYSFTYGRAEALIRIDPRLGSWPAFWTLGAAYQRDTSAWPAAGEVDIMEYYRHTVLANVCIPKASWCGWSSTRQPLAGLGGQSWADRFHLWAMDWSARRIDLFLDGKLVHRFAVAGAALGGRRNPYVGRPAFLLLSQAIGGARGGHPTHTEFPVRLEADYVRVYQRTRSKDQREGGRAGFPPPAAPLPSPPPRSLHDAVLEVRYPGCLDRAELFKLQVRSHAIEEA